MILVGSWLILLPTVPSWTDTQTEKGSPFRLSLSRQVGPGRDCRHCWIKAAVCSFCFFFPWLKHRFQINGTEKNWILSKLELVTPGLVVSMFGFFEWLTHDDPPNWGAFRPLRVISRNENLKIVAESSDFFQQCCLQTKKRWREVAFQDALDIIWIHTFCIILNAICLFIFPFLFWWNFSDLNFGAWIFRCDFWSRKRRMLGEDVLPFIPCWGHHHLCIYALTTQSLWANEMRVLRIYTFDTDINIYIYNMTISTYFFEYRCVCIYIYTCVFVVGVSPTSAGMENKSRWNAAMPSDFF